MSQKKKVSLKIKVRKIKGLYGITGSDSSRIINQVEAVLAGGASVIQYRNKSHNFNDALQIGGKVVDLCRRYNATFIVNDDVALMLALDADGIHLGKNDATIESARHKIGNKIIGVSCYNNLNLAIDAEKQGVDYVAFGRFYPSQTKPQAIEASINVLREAKQRINVPIVAIGGITLDNAKLLIDAGADSVAVINGLFNEVNIRATAEKFSSLFK